MKNQKKLSKRKLIRQRTQIVRESTKTYTRKIKSDTKKAISTALIAAFGFVIALAWKDVIIEYVDTLTASSPLQGKLIGALIVTFIAVIGILIVTRFLSEKK